MSLVSWLSWFQLFPEVSQSLFVSVATLEGILNIENI